VDSSEPVLKLSGTEGVYGEITLRTSIFRTPTSGATPNRDLVPGRIQVISRRN
jgi:hypothetical protein